MPNGDPPLEDAGAGAIDETDAGSSKDPIGFPSSDAGGGSNDEGHDGVGGPKAGSDASCCEAGDGGVTDGEDGVTGGEDGADAGTKDDEGDTDGDDGVSVGGSGDDGSSDGDADGEGDDGEEGGGDGTTPPSGPSNGCTYTQGYWRNHPEEWPLSMLTLGSETYTADEARAILETPVGGDASIMLAHQLIAALLNVARGASSNDAIADAQAWLTANGGRLPFGIAAAAAPDAVALNVALTQYNEGLAGPPHCGDQIWYGCTYTQGYWRNHEDAWPVSALTLGSETYTDEEAHAIQEMSVEGDASINLAHQLIAALLNVASGASPIDAIDDAQAWLSANGTRLAFGIPSADAPDAIALAADLTRYNEGLVGPPHCAE